MRSPTRIRLWWFVPPALLGGGALFGRENLQSNALTRLKSASSKSSTYNPGDSQDRDASPKITDPKSLTESLSETEDAKSAWTTFTRKFGAIMDCFGTIDWSTIRISVKNHILPDWAQFLPEPIQKLQRELSMAPGSLSEEIWREAQEVEINPEIARSAEVRIGGGLCQGELAFRQKRRAFTVKALAKYLDIKEDQIHPDDVPIVAMCGSGGGLRALVAGTGSYLATQEAGLWDCVTYMAGVSGSCWLQALYGSALTRCDFHRLVDHLKNRLTVHIAFPPKALNLLTTAPTNKYLLCGLVEKLRGDPGADFGLVDIYGLLLSARLLVPRGELDLSDRDLKLSYQRDYLKYGANPLPIYTAVRHEIPRTVEKVGYTSKWGRSTERLEEVTRQETWFQWFEFTPYEFYCEELSAGIPMWALGRRFNDGRSVVTPGEYAAPELRIPVLMGIWGSAFCATLSHYYKEIRPVVKGLTGFGGIDSLIEGNTKNLIKMHPIDPGSIPNFVLGMRDRLPSSCPESIFHSSHLQLMDAGISNNLPIYPLLRPGRNVDIIIAFDASADIKQENWLSVVDGYARQRGIQGWPIGAGWPEGTTEPDDTVKTLKQSQDINKAESDRKLTISQGRHGGDLERCNTDLTYCNVWVGTKQEKTSDKEPPPPRRLFYPKQKGSPESDHIEPDFDLMRPDAGIAVIYFPLLPNSSAPGFSPPSQGPKSSQLDSAAAGDVSGSQSPAFRSHSIRPDTDDFLSTWNFVYTPQQIDAVIGLAKANFSEGEGQVKRVVRGVYERKKRDRLRTEREILEAKVRQLELERKRWQEGILLL